MIAVVKFWIVVGCLTKSGSKGIKIGDVKALLQNGAPKVAVKCFQDKVIRSGTRTQHDVSTAF